jgi:hypothetical protein
MWSVNYDRLFEAALRELLTRGHAVHVAFETDKDGLSGDLRLFEALRDEFGEIAWSLVPQSRNAFARGLRRRVRLTLDLLRYWEPEYARSDTLRARALERAPRPARAAAGLYGVAPLRYALRGLLRRVDRVIRPDPAVVELVEREQPDVVVATPLVMLGSTQGEVVRAARSRGIPTAFVVASWDNLTNKGLVHDRPDLTIVWNDAQRREAIELHGLPEQSVVATGAHSYDHWFDWEPSRDREAFCSLLGLDPARPILLYACSSPFIAPHEVVAVRRWLDIVRGSDAPLLRDASVVVRPHPANAQPWEARAIADPGRTVVWPRRGAKPVDAQAKQDYYDSLFHAAAVVGINTSALVESAIVGRPSFTLLDPELVGAQEGTLHFAHLTALHAARTPQEHERQLLEALSGEVDETRTQAFVESFLRPHGAGRRAAPLLVDELEALVERRPTILFALDHPGFLLHFDETIRGLAARGNRVHVAFARPDKWPDGLEGLAHAEHVVVEDAAPGRTRAARAARALRRLSDYVHYLDPALAGAVYARRKWRGLAPVAGPLRRVDTLPRPLVRGLLAALRLAERSLPVATQIDRFVARIAPDALVVSPLVDARTDLSDYLAAGLRRGIPTALAVASWDNLSSKGLVRRAPDRVFVWNETQRREAVEYHHLPAGRVEVTGAQSYDRWFDREPSEPFTAFAARHGLDGAERIVLFAGSTKQAQAPELEPAFVRDWVSALRAHPDLRDVGILVRPHPTNAEAWRDVELDDPRAVVWRRARDLPIASDERSAYYDALHHCAAVVAINSTVLIEATILDRPAHTVALPEFHELQRDLLHYHYLLPENGGFLREARSLDQHVRLLADDLRDPTREAARRREFVRAFIRPAGLDVPSTPRLIDGIERLARYR